MKFVLAPDSFKESMTSKEVCNAMTEGIRKVFSNAEIIAVPMADGGEGTMQSMIDSTNGTIYSEIVKGPLGRDIKAQFGILGDKNTAIVEAAEACGLQLVDKSLRNPLITTTYGVGQLIKSALDMNINKLIITLGGSSTNDGGVGMLQALGVKFLDEKDEEISFGGAFLSKIRKIDISMIDKRIKNIKRAHSGGAGRQERTFKGLHIPAGKRRDLTVHIHSGGYSAVPGDDYQRVLFQGR